MGTYIGTTLRLIYYLGTWTLKPLNPSPYGTLFRTLKGALKGTPIWVHGPLGVAVSYTHRETRSSATTKLQTLNRSQY